MTHTNSPEAPVHHPAFDRHAPITSSQDAEFLNDFLGIRTRVEFLAGYSNLLSVVAPVFNEEYCEWVDLLEAVDEARDEFVMVEVGAGYGRWLMRGAAAATRKLGCRFVGVGVEAEPEHFRWMRRHFADNGVNPDDVDLRWAAVGPTVGFVPFWIGNPGGWYGQSVASETTAPFPDLGARRRLRAQSVLGQPPAGSETDQATIWVPCTTLADVIADYSRIDLIDLDIQGLEYDVLSSAADLLDARVRRVHVGTHSAEVEQGLRRLFTGHGWRCLNDYPCASQVPTPWGEISFTDGVQTWINDRL